MFFFELSLQNFAVGRVVTSSEASPVETPQFKNISFRQIEQFEQVARSQCLIFVFAHALAIAVAVLLAGVCSPA